MHLLLLQVNYMLDFTCMGLVELQGTRKWQNEQFLLAVGLETKILLSEVSSLNHHTNIMERQNYINSID